MDLLLCEIARILCKQHLLLGNNRFSAIYQELVELFSSKVRFVKMNSGFFVRKNWPKGSGVYVIWGSVGKTRKLIYIGKTGTYRRTGKLVGINNEKDKYKERMGRWTPYCFFEEYFCFGPQFKGSAEPKPNNDSNYGECIPISEIEIDFFVCGTGSVAPAFLESLLLQIYMDEHSTLPPANNEF
jgi:hypothetical protein